MPCSERVEGQVAASREDLVLPPSTTTNAIVVAPRVNAARTRSVNSETNTGAAPASTQTRRRVSNTFRHTSVSPRPQIAFVAPVRGWRGFDRLAPHPTHQRVESSSTLQRCGAPVTRSRIHQSITNALGVSFAAVVPSASTTRAGAIPSRGSELSTHVRRSVLQTWT